MANSPAASQISCHTRRRRSRIKRQSTAYVVAAAVVNARRQARALAGPLLGVVILLSLLTPSVAHAEAAIRILALGDSLTAGYGLSQEAAFPAQLESALRAKGHDVEIINAGVSGDTTAGGLARLDWALSPKPEYAIVALGANDALRAVEPSDTFNNLDTILSRLKAKDVRILVAGMYAPPNLGREYADAFNAVFPRLAKKHGVALYPFFLDGVAANSALNQRDGIHPNADGIAVMVERILPYVADLIDGD